jgi:hypothetical protein
LFDTHSDTRAWQIFNASLWDAYDESRWAEQFRCQTRQAFGQREPGAPVPASWLAGSPVHLAELPGAVPVAGPVLLIHSPEDDWVQAAQATQMFAALQPLATAPQATAAHRIDTEGACARGQHPAVLTGASAVMLSACIADLVLQGR